MYETRYVIVGLLYCLVFTVAGLDIIRNEDICGVHNGRRLYLELGEKGILYAKNVSFAKNEPRQDIPQTYASNSSHEQCSLELVTCPSCVIIVTFRSIALSHHCGDGGVTMDSPCRCDYVWISEPPYEDVSGTPFCGMYVPLIYRSSTRTLSITLLFSQSHKHAFTLEYTAERNRMHLKGTELTAGGSKGLNNTGGGILTSPFFPARYPRDLGLEYIVTCPNDAPTCRIRLLFSDFQLATVSIMEFYDWNGQRLDVSSGARFRPPVIVSSGPSLLIRFYANGGTGLGYKAFYSFVIGHLVDKSVQPITDCGGYVENLGGAITMVDMVDEGVKTYDCVWLIRPPKNFLHMKTHMYLKVVTFLDMAGNTELVIKQGPTSALLPLEVLRHPARQLQLPRHREHIAPVTSGFHVSLRGVFGPSSHLAIAYSAFSYTDCFAGSDFLCQNHRCIPSQLNCDGFDHCGDNSDEPATCFREWELEPQDRKWRGNKANYYFPKIDRYPDLKTATLVFVASSLGLIILISALIILLYRMGARARQQRELQSRLQTISELLVFDITDGARIDEISVSDEPPVYEAPPGYDEVVKLSLEAETARRKKRSLARDPPSGNSPGQCSLDLAQSSTCLVSEGEGSSGNSQSRPITLNRSVPESPPPPYVTPPGTFPRNFIIPGLISYPSSSRELEGDRAEDLMRSRHEWLRQSGEFSRSLSLTEPLAAEGLSSSIDAEVLGAYLQDRVGSSPNCTAEYSDPQPRSLLDASIDIEPECMEEEDVGQEVLQNREEIKEEDDAAGDPEDKSGADVITECSCQGACGCANNSQPSENNIPTIEHNNENVIVTTTASVSAICSVFNQLIASLAPINHMPLRSSITSEADSSTMTTSTPEEASLPPATSSGTAGTVPCKNSSESSENESNNTKPAREIPGQDEIEDTSDGAFDIPDDREILEEQHEEHTKDWKKKNEDDDTSSTKSAIVRLLSSRTSKGSANASTTASTPSSSLRRSMRKFSVCSRDSYVTKISAASSWNSYDKLHDEFETVSETGSTLVITPDNSPRKRRGVCRRSRRYSSCDLESLYEGMKVLDSFVLRRGLTVGHGRKHSVAVMLFGTPEHGRHRGYSIDGSSEYNAGDIEPKMQKRARIWKSNEDAFSN